MSQLFYANCHHKEGQQKDQTREQSRKATVEHKLLKRNKKPHRNQKSTVGTQWPTPRGGRRTIPSTHRKPPKTATHPPREAESSAAIIPPRNIARGWLTLLDARLAICLLRRTQYRKQKDDSRLDQKWQTRLMG